MFGIYMGMVTPGCGQSDIRKRGNVPRKSAGWRSGKTRDFFIIMMREGVTSRRGILCKISRDVYICVQGPRIQEQRDMAQKKTRAERELEALMRKIGKKVGRTPAPVREHRRDAAAEYDPELKDMDADEIFRIMKRREF